MENPMDDAPLIAVAAAGWLARWAPASRLTTATARQEIAYGRWVPSIAFAHQLCEALEQTGDLRADPEQRTARDRGAWRVTPQVRDARAPLRLAALGLDWSQPEPLLARADFTALRWAAFRIAERLYDAQGHSTFQVYPVDTWAIMRRLALTAMETTSQGVLLPDDAALEAGLNRLADFGVLRRYTPASAGFAIPLTRDSIPDPLLQKDAAALLGVSTSAVSRWVAEGVFGQPGELDPDAVLQRRLWEGFRPGLGEWLTPPPSTAPAAPPCLAP